MRIAHEISTLFAVAATVLATFPSPAARAGDPILGPVTHVDPRVVREEMTDAQRLDLEAEFRYVGDVLSEWESDTANPDRGEANVSIDAFFAKVPPATAQRVEHAIQRLTLDALPADLNVNGLNLSCTGPAACPTDP